MKLAIGTFFSTIISAVIFSLVETPPALAGGFADSYAHIRTLMRRSLGRFGTVTTGEVELDLWRMNDPPFQGDVKAFLLDNSPFIYDLPLNNPFDPSQPSEAVLTLTDDMTGNVIGIESLQNLEASYTINYEEGVTVDDIISFTTIDFNVTGFSQILGEDVSITLDTSEPLTGEYDLAAAEGTKLDPFLAFNLSDWRVDFSFSGDTAGSETSVLVSGSETEASLDVISKKVPEPSSTLALLTLGTLGAAETLKRKLKPSKSTKKELEKIS